MTLREAGDMAWKAWEYAKYFATYLNVEEKLFDVSSNTTYSSSFSISNLSNIAQGADWNTRDGNSILVQDCLMNLVVTMNASATATQFRLIIFVDKDNRGVDPSASDLLETSSAPLILVAPFNHYSAGRFQILHDSLSTLSFYNPSHQINFFRKHNQHVYYQGTSGADGSDWKGQLYALFVSNEATNSPTAYWYWRMRFTDN